MTVCKASDCKREPIIKGLCGKHYQQVRMFGETKRTRTDPNEIIIQGEIAKVKLYRKNKEIAEAIIDVEDVERVMRYRWYFHSCGYCANKSRGKSIYLHRYIMKSPQKMQTDHINHNKLDNRKSNLRICGAHDNCANQSTTYGKSKYKGVYWDNNRNKWTAGITIKNHKFLGYYKNEKLAARIYDYNANKLCKELKEFCKPLNV